MKTLREKFDEIVTLTTKIESRTDYNELLDRLVALADRATDTRKICCSYCGDLYPFSELTEALACRKCATADAPENSQTARAREQAGGLDHWANVLEAHEPDSSAAGIVMLREAAKTLRELARRRPNSEEDE